MKNEGMRRDAVTMDGLVGELLGLDPAVLATMATPVAKEAGASKPGAASQAGLNCFMRRVLALCLALEDVEHAVVRLKTEATARANGWPDARTANVAMLLAWALVSSDRRVKALPDVPLLVADDPDDPAADPLDPEPDPTVATADLIARMSRTISITDEVSKRRRRGIAQPGFERPPVISSNALIRTLLGLDPKVLASALDQTRDEPGFVYASDPEGAGRGGLNRLIRDALTQYRTMKRRDIDRVRLMTERDATQGGRPDARSANFATLLSCGLLCEDGWTFEFLPARASLPREEELIKRVAHHAYFCGSEQAFAALELLCDDHVHFGACGNYGKADRIFGAIREEYDPAGNSISAMPFPLQLKAMTRSEGIDWLLSFGTVITLG